MKGKWIYADTRSHKAGLMVCCSCNKKINDGEFRYRMDYKLDGFQCQHRSCSKEDANWQRVDAEEEARSAEEEQFENDCKWMSEKYGIDIDYLLDAVRG